MLKKIGSPLGWQIVSKNKAVLCPIESRYVLRCKTAKMLQNLCGFWNSVKHDPSRTADGYLWLIVVCYLTDCIVHCLMSSEVRAAEETEITTLALDRRTKWSQISAVCIVCRALICYWDHLKNFFAEITQGPSGMSIGTIWMDQKRFQGPPARGFWFF